MEKIQGTLVRLGQSTVARDSVNYSVIQIGDRVLKDIDISAKLSNFIGDGLKQSEAMTLYLNSSGAATSVIGFEINGKTYYDSSYAAGSLFGLLVGAFSAVAGFAAIALLDPVFRAAGADGAVGVVWAFAFIAIPVCGKLGYSQYCAKVCRPEIFKTWEAQGAIAV